MNSISSRETSEEEKALEDLYDNYWSGMKKKVKDLLEYYDDSKEKGLENLKTVENIEIYKTFVDVCLIHLKDASCWTENCASMSIRDIFTASDEAMAALYFENYASDFKIMAETGKKIEKKDSRPRFTRSSDKDLKYQGWHEDGIKRYNILIKAFIAHRRSENCDELEEEIRKDLVAFKYGKNTYSDLTREEVENPKTEVTTTF